MSLRKHHADLASLKRSRSGYSGNITKVGDKLDELAAQDLSTFTVRTIEKLITSIKNSETGYLHTLEDAQTLLAKEEDSEELLTEEAAAVEQFQLAVSDANHDAASLLSLKSIGKKLRNFTSALRAVRDAFSARPEADQAGALIPLETTYAAILKDWDDGDHEDDHPLKALVDDCRSQLTQLSFEMAGTRDMTPVSSHDRSISSFSCCDGPRKQENKLPTIEVPTFHGDVMKWATFWAAFQSAVGNRDSLSDTTKLIYLRKAIKDPETQTLLTDPREDVDLYPEIVKELHARFDRTKEVHRNLVQRLLQFTSIKETRADIRRLMDTLKSTLSSLKRTGTYCLDTFLTSLVYLLLPVKMQTLWEQYTKKSKKVTVVQDLIQHFSEHAETLPSTQLTHQPSAKQEHSEKKQHKRQEQSSYKGQKASVHVVTPSPSYKWDCALCKTEKHPLFVCPKWLTFTIDQRLSHVREKNLCSNCLAVGHSTANCRSTYRCRDCNSNHHTTIYQATMPSTPIHSSSGATSQVPDALMMTAQVMISGPGGHQVSARALIDSGAGMSLVSHRVSQLLNLPLTRNHLQFSGVQGTPCKPSRHITHFNISPMQADLPKVLVKAAVVPTVTVDLPTRELTQVKDLPHLSDLQLADPNFHSPGRIDILLGADVYLQLMLQTPVVTGGKNDPGALKTIFGWAIMGPVKASNDTVQSIPTHVSQIQCTEEEHLDDQMCKFWEVEEPDHPPEKFSSTEELVQAHYDATTTYCQETCRYTVTLPRKTNIPALGDSRAQAMSRYVHNETSILRRKIYKPFQDVVQSYMDLGHAELVPSAELHPDISYYLPMHSVTKQSSTSTKLRVVFDGSAASTSGVSLNQSLMIGPTLHPTLGAILIKFRSYPIAVTADISKMYREVSLSPQDKDLHRFLWRPTPQDSIQDYRMTRVTFGVSASPYLAVRTLQQAATDHGEGRPGASRHILESFYVDDLLAGADTPQEAIILYHDLRAILSKAEFNLCKWRSSSNHVLTVIPSNLQETLPVKEMTESHSPSHPKALGLEWDSRLDLMAPAIQPSKHYNTTKRGVVSDVSKTFDILGWISPSVLVMKLLYQQLWQLKTGWDEQIPSNLIDQHALWRQQLPVLASKQLPRCYYRTDATPLTKQLHGFADASLKAYGAVLYVRSTYKDHPPLLSLFISKTRVAKLKPSTVPRQELCAAVLLTELLTEVKGILQIPEDDTYCWSDSSIVLSWLDGHPRDYKVFVTNRIHSILQATSPQTWRHVPTAQNPADCASRGLMPQELLDHSLWWDGPDWLLHDPISIPWQPPRKPLIAPEQRAISCNSMQPAPPPLLESRYSNYHKLISITAWCWRFYSKTSKKECTFSGKYLTAKELYQAEHLLARLSQSGSFPKERDSLLHDRTISPSSRLLSLAPYLDQELLLRVGGRLSNSSLTLSQKHPIITDSKDVLMTLLCNYLHVCLGHCGPTLLLVALGRRFHVVSARRLTRSICSQCKVCRKAAPKTHPQQLGELPAERICTSPAFTSTGLDFAGPFTIKKGHTRKPSYLKAYLCLFVCLSTKAIHIEVISDLTTASFLAGLKRFVARRGCPTTIHSDNGSNFVGARNQLKEIYNFLKSEDTDSAVHQHLLKNRITWDNIPERAPHFGGLWESAVKTMKYHLKRVVGSQILTYEELSTVSSQVEACLNSRPLLATTSHDADGITSLTPGHFLLLKPPTAYPDYPGLPEEPCRLKKWHLCQSIIQHFWHRWSREYLQTLQARSKWKTPQPNLQAGDIVVLKEDKTFSCHWPLAKILHTYPGKDGLVREAQVRTGNSTFKRPVTKLALLHREELPLQGPVSQGLPPGVWLGKNHNRCPQDEQAPPSSKQVSSSGKMPEALPSQMEEH